MSGIRSFQVSEGNITRKNLTVSGLNPDTVIRGVQKLVLLIVRTSFRHGDHKTTNFTATVIEGSFSFCKRKIQEKVKE